ncbi:ATP-dependent DNA helicase [Obba rivulosa]|uniref:ATP-dependent DNA helicase n=1 Tax=Obba rivulosa TaxID=1052685 RepID=A0A8E2DSS8_9APHY|nr:ATP-dependent DNA helicase [Obba rivulosa]
METPWYSEVQKKLLHVFKVESFRRNQLEAINATLDGQDVFLLMPTGGGKSLCFQLPAICETGRTKGVTVVIGPLISLMDDQVQALREKGIDVEALNKDMPAEKSREIRQRLRHSSNKPKLLYVTPERIQLDDMNETLGLLYRQGLLARFAVDEVHCISEWGRDFRDAYKALDVLRKNFPKVPIMALTGTATKRVVNDIVTRLKIEGCLQLRQSFNRRNLNYMVEAKVGRGLAKIVEFINSKHHGKTGIIYCRSRIDCEQVAGELCDQHRIPAKYFHAGLDRETKTQILQDWQSGACKVVVATTAFGMGIDKADVRFVIHQCLPRSLEGYYQETGRAGRDGKPADCVLYYNYGDAQSLFRLIRNEDTTSAESKEASEDGLRRVVQFCQNVIDCRREQVLAYFDEKFDPRDCNEQCDNCRNGGSVQVQDVTEITKMIVSRMPNDEYRITRNQLVDIVRGSQKKDLREKGFDQLSLFGICKDKGENVERIIDLMLSEQYLATRSIQCHQAWTKEYLKRLLISCGEAGSFS